MVIHYGFENQYDDEGYCPVCNSSNKLKIIDAMEHIILELDTECKKCGHKNHWAHGKFINEYKEIGLFKESTQKD